VNSTGQAKVIGDKILKKERKREYELSRSDRFRYRTRYFTDSGVIGSKEFVIENPEKTVIQSDGRIRKWSKITEANKYLRVILLEDGVTVHNAFFDRSYKEEKK
jgi:hypothetical protein